VKRTLDIAISLAGLVLLCPLIALIAIAVKVDSRGPVFFYQARVGRHFLVFHIVKFRTMIANAEHSGPLITRGEDTRITRVGRFLRRMKLDELPQLVNVLRGEMSLVGPRPEVPKYVEEFRPDYEEVLSVRPGITDPASIEFLNEESLLDGASDLEREYIERVLPRKLFLSKRYIREASTLSDLRIILATLYRGL
jgi:lipopolysaccharide/colanic/teichoic acid biosynthesis glycosyltransferase